MALFIGINTLNKAWKEIPLGHRLTELYRMLLLLDLLAPCWMCMCA